ncbi:hypothetical protein BD779DRAFT_326329 [Infundibulicybe gibba]|nr:hypothetical protein BD779DRAFT_326329 [Infundibulicybe gibba]
MAGSQEVATSDSSQISPIPSSPHLPPVDDRLQPQTKLKQPRPVLDIISESFPPFDCGTTILGPYEAETLRDAKFEAELSSMILDTLIESHAWSVGRPKSESLNVERDLEPKINSIIEIEKEQGMSTPLHPYRFSSTIVEKTRAQLNQFVIQMKSALATLTSGFL